MIREATEKDIPRIVEMGSRSLAEGPYGAVIKDIPEQAAKLALQVIQNAKGRILLLEEDGVAVGLLGFIIFPHWFTQEITANEIMWYVEAEHRKGGGAIKLFWAAEELAKTLGAKKMQFSAPNEQVGSIYERFGYRKIEVGYQKDLTARLGGPSSSSAQA